MKKVIILFAAVLFITSISAQSIEAGSLRTDFVAKTSTGNTVDFDQLQGKTVVMVFWSATDEKSQSEIPEILEMSSSFQKDEQVVFLGISPDSHAANAKNFNINVPYLSFIPNANELIRQHQISSFPSYIIFDQNGKKVPTGRTSNASGNIKDQLFAQIMSLQD